MAKRTYTFKKPYRIKRIKQNITRPELEKEIKSSVKVLRERERQFKKKFGYVPASVNKRINKLQKTLSEFSGKTGWKLGSLKKLTEDELKFLRNKVRQLQDNPLITTSGYIKIKNAKAEKSLAGYKAKHKHDAVDKERYEEALATMEDAYRMYGRVNFDSENIRMFMDNPDILSTPSMQHIFEIINDWVPLSGLDGKGLTRGETALQARLRTELFKDMSDFVAHPNDIRWRQRGFHDVEDVFRDWMSRNGKKVL